MSDEVRTRLILDGDSVHVSRVQDAEPLLEWAKDRAKQPNPRGEKFWEKWTLTAAQVEHLFNRYSAGDFTKNMDKEFWVWVDKVVMTDPDYGYLRLANKSNPFFTGFNK